MIKIFLRTLFDWLFVPHGYLGFKKYEGTPKQMQEIFLMVLTIGGHARKGRCLVCGTEFWAVKANPTCRRIKCFFAYRLKKEYGGKNVRVYKQ